LSIRYTQTIDTIAAKRKEINIPIILLVFLT
jgi:hypothetical protein